MNILFIGDIFGRPGRNIIIDELKNIIKEFSLDAVIANGENIAHGKGITKRTAAPLFEAGIDVFTSGNHLWDKKDSIDYINEERRILKPINYTKNSPGNTFYQINLQNDEKLIVLNLVGQSFMPPANSPFEIFDEIYKELPKTADNILIDFHAEATAEKRAFGYYVNGKVAAVVGTHTHIQTADEEILSNGTAYITDVGMTGSHDSVIGVKKEIILKKIKTGVPIKYEVAETGLQLNAVFLKIENGKTKNIIRIKRNYGK